MDRSTRVAVVGPNADALAEGLRRLPLRPEVRCFVSLCEAGDALQRLQPQVLFADAGRDSAEEIGALRVLKQLWPELVVILTTAAESELRHAALAERLGARLLLLPCSQAQLATALDQANLGTQAPRAEEFRDLAHGIADEINNPLLFVSGHLQLLVADLDAAKLANETEQAKLALTGLQSISVVVDRLRVIADAANGQKRRERVALAPLLQQAMSARRLIAEQAQVKLADAPCEVDGDPEQLAAALHAAVEFADALARGGSSVELTLRSHARAVSLTLRASGPGMADWRLPQSFQPYYPHRMLQGYGHGLHLFLLQAVVHGHRGQARAERKAQHVVVIEYLLNKAES